MGHPWERLTLGPEFTGFCLWSYSGFLFFVVAAFCKVTEYWISKYWAIDAEGNTELGLWEPLVTAFLPTNQYTILFYMCFFFVGGAFPGGSVVKNSPANAGATGDVGLIPGLERSPGEGPGNTIQDSCWEIPPTEEPGGLQSTGPQCRLWGKCLSTNVFFTGTSLKMYYWFISIKFLSHTMTHRWMKLIQHLYFLCEICHNLLALRDTSHSIMLGGHYKQQNHPQKPKNVQNVTLNMLQEKATCYSLRTRTGRQNTALFDLSWDLVYGQPVCFTSLHVTATTVKMPSVLIWGATHEIWWVGEATIMDCEWWELTV